MPTVNLRQFLPHMGICHVFLSGHLPKTWLEARNMGWWGRARGQPSSRGNNAGPRTFRNQMRLSPELMQMSSLQIHIG